jgi:hypothetical protein
MDGGEMAVGRVHDELVVIVESEAGYCFGELSTIGGLMGRVWVWRVHMGEWGDTLVELLSLRQPTNDECVNGSNEQSRHRR